MIFQIFRIMENILDSSLFLTRIWVDSVNKLTLVAIRIARDFFALTIEKTGIVDGLRLLKRRGVIDDLNDDDDKIILKLKKEFDEDGLSNYIYRCISKSSDKLLLLVCLVRMADALAPSLRIVSLASTLDQAFEIIVFIHEKTHAINVSKAMNVNLANDIWRNKHIETTWFQTYFIKHLKSGGCKAAIYGIVFFELHDKYLSHFLIQELHDIINIVGDPRVDAIRNAIFNSLNESVQAFEFQENVKTAMELVARFKDVDPLHYANHNIGSFMTTDSPKWKKMKQMSAMSFL
ncbi:hypothetical protein Syun_030611 [Stephania yunnanensis]|uniref:Uncharacterized protein n=1 Tax=Stephania yunnanensis TaxID=152371 RepID=A0AAP0E1Y9_9MAGN